MKQIPTIAMEKALDWCASVLGPFEVMSDHSKIHGGHESSTCRLHAAQIGFCYVKVHQTQSHWNNAVHAYEQWAHAFGDFAPSLLAVHDNEPLALLISELSGQILENTQLSPSREQAVWRSAGEALSVLHDLGTGECFGPCLRDGSYVEDFPLDAREYVSRKLNSQIDQAIQGKYISAEELTTLHAASELIPAFEGERPVPCHRDYCAANWLVGREGRWTGVIDFEFAYRDVRVADFSRDPNWSWIDRPDLIDAFFEGYGRSLSPKEEQQLLVAHTEYALSAILWGGDHAFYGFEREGHEALTYLAGFLK